MATYCTLLLLRPFFSSSSPQSLGEFKKADRQPTVNAAQANEILQNVRSQVPQLYEDVVNLRVHTEGGAAGDDLGAGAGATGAAGAASRGAVVAVTGAVAPASHFNILTKPSSAWTRVFYRKQKAVFSLAENELVYVCVYAWRVRVNACECV